MRAARNAASSWSASELTGCPAICTRPEVGRSRVPAMVSSVDFPEPDGPVKAVNSPSLIASEIPRRAATGGAPG